MTAARIRAEKHRQTKPPAPVSFTPRRRTRFCVVPATALALSVVILTLSSCAQPREVITIGTIGGIRDTLIFVANDKDFFRTNGIEVRLHTYANGAAAVEGMLNGEVMVAYASEYVTVRHAFMRSELSIFVVEARSTGTFVVGRKDRGIATVADLQGKRIGVPKGAIPEFFLGRFLRLNGISVSHVAVVDVRPADIADALSTGAVDAVVAAARFFQEIKRAQGDNVVYWPAESNQPHFDTLVATNRWLSSNPKTVQSFLSALAMAQDFAVRNPHESLEIANARLGWERPFLEEQWSQIYLSLSLDRTLVAAMEDQAQWMISSGLTPEIEIPDFADYVYPDGLKAVKPEAVDLGG